MDHYQDIRVLPDPEFSEPQLMAALFAKLHRALAAYAQGDIGVSFPSMQRTPGTVLRLHGSCKALTELQQSGWLKGLRDYTGVDLIQASAGRSSIPNGQPGSVQEQCRASAKESGQ